MRVAHEFGICLPPPEEVGDMDQETEKFALEFPEMRRFAFATSAFNQAVISDNYLLATRDLMEMEHTRVIPLAHGVLHFHYETFICAFSDRDIFWKYGSDYLKAWERGVFEDCLFFLTRMLFLLPQGGPIHKVIYDFCTERLVQFRDRPHISLDGGESRFYFPIPTEPEDFFKDFPY